MTALAGRSRKSRRSSSRPLEVVIEDAVAYWLEDDRGQRLCPDSDRTIEPFAKALELP